MGITDQILSRLLGEILSPKPIGCDDCACETCKRIKLATIPYHERGDLKFRIVRQDHRGMEREPDPPFQPWTCQRCGYAGTPHVKHCRECDHRPQQEISTTSPPSCIPVTQCPVCTERDPYALLRAIQAAIRAHRQLPDKPADPLPVYLKEQGPAVLEGFEIAIRDLSDQRQTKRITLSLYLPKSQRTVMFAGVFVDSPEAEPAAGRRAHGSGRVLRERY